MKILQPQQSLMSQKHIDLFPTQKARLGNLEALTNQTAMACTSQDRAPHAGNAFGVADFFSRFGFWKPHVRWCERHRDFPPGLVDSFEGRPKRPLGSAVA